MRGNTISFSASKHRQQLKIVSELSDEIKILEERINNADLPEPNIIDRIQDLKDRLEVEVEKEDLETANKAFAKMKLEGEKPTKYFCSEKISPP